MGTADKRFLHCLTFQKSWTLDPVLPPCPVLPCKAHLLFALCRKCQDSACNCPAFRFQNAFLSAVPDLLSAQCSLPLSWFSLSLVTQRLGFFSDPFIPFSSLHQRQGKSRWVLFCLVCRKNHSWSGVKGTWQKWFRTFITLLLLVPDTLTLSLCLWIFLSVSVSLLSLSFAVSPHALSGTPIKSLFQILSFHFGYAWYLAQDTVQTRKVFCRCATVQALLTAWFFRGKYILVVMMGSADAVSWCTQAFWKA